MKSVNTFAQTGSPTPAPSLVPAPADPVQTSGAIVAIALAVAAGILGYRILRGGRGL